MSQRSDRAKMSFICPVCDDRLQAFSIELAGQGIRDLLQVVQITCRRCGTSVFWNNKLPEPRWVTVA